MKFWMVILLLTGCTSSETAAKPVERVTLIILKEDGTREKFQLNTLVGVPRKQELLWIGEVPHKVIEVEYAVAEDTQGARTIEATGVYVRPFAEEDQAATIQLLRPPGQ